jgi:dephospho-CoA kinase
VLRVGLTGGLGAGKSTVLRMFAARGAEVLQSDTIGRELMQPGQAVYAAIVELFGGAVVLPNKGLDRPALARLAFAGGRLEELNDIVHPAVFARQEELLCQMTDKTIVVIESALIFESKYASPEGSPKRFDRIVLVTAPESVKIARFLERSSATPETAAALTAEARRRLTAQIPDEAKMQRCDFVLHNDGDMVELEVQVERVWQQLLRVASERN